MAGTASKEQIINAAWTVLTNDGINTFSMRHLAKEVGVSASTLYWHFENKSTIFDAMMYQVCQRALSKMTTEKDWKQRLLSDGMTLSKTMRQFPNAADLLLVSQPNTDNYLELYERFLKDVEELNLTDLEKFNVISIYVNYVLTFERDYQIQQANKPRKNMFSESDEDKFANVAPILNRMRNQGLFKSLGTDETLRWSLQTLIEGFDTRQQTRNN